MILRETLILLLTFVFEAKSVFQCYQCTIAPSSNYNGEIDHRLCSSFDYSNKYIVDCPSSTMCMKKTYVLALANGERIVAELRDCAPQVNRYQALRKGTGWEEVSEIEEPYADACENDAIDSDKANTESCYCRGYLCNSATRSQPTQDYIDIASVVLVFNLLKYISSIT